MIFKSTDIRINLTKVPPTTLMENQIKFNLIPTFIKTIYSRSNTYPPDFNKIAGKIIEPLTGRLNTTICFSECGLRILRILYVCSAAA